MFVAPDPGRVRLRFAARGVLGIGLAVVVCGLAGHSLTASITGGLAALLALFTVADPTIRGQAVTTALLPAVGFPVLALAAALHDGPLARNAAFLVIVGVGVYARKWGPRGHALGIFGFMTFFVTQFLHTVPGQLLELYGSLLLALASSSAVRFVFWCYERSVVVPAVPVISAGRGLARVTTRQAVQAAIAGAFALGIGQFLSEDRWYWAVGTVWWAFVNTTSRGETLVRGFRRVLGTLVGIAVAMGIAVPLHGAPLPTAVLLAICVFAIFYTAAVSYSWMMLAVTLMTGLLYGMLDVLDAELLALRLAQTGVGALGAVLAVLLILPVTTHETTDAWIRRALRCVQSCTSEAAARLAGTPNVDPAPRVAELELLLGRVRLSLAPLVHPFNPLRARKARAHQILVLLDLCMREVRGLANVAADPAASHDIRLAAACWRVEAAVEALMNPQGSAAPILAKAESAAAHMDHAALTHLHGLERALAGLVTPLHSIPRSPFTGMSAAR
ncbi:FUSC family protein [Streptomyces sp. H27-C3]|uniref:FUSC family protein n=1 Tax=Streptomyces sp. H27-C3 TaxID=3046305 RepID=UPI0024BB93AB|nr:FUSC family protein [Streptomyces sp. H27-C3]MDJ0463712.1 FUSC family protein [Streptomyces sp. H27-C3]